MADFCIVSTKEDYESGREAALWIGLKERKQTVNNVVKWASQLMPCTEKLNHYHNITHIFSVDFGLNHLFVV